MEQIQKALSTNLFSLEDALRELEETREEAEEAYASDDEIDPVPNSAYDDARVLLKILHRDVPIQTLAGQKMAALDSNGGQGTVSRRWAYMVTILSFTVRFSTTSVNSTEFARCQISFYWRASLQH